MSRWADWIPLPPEEADRFTEAWLTGDDAVTELLEPLLGDNGASELDMDKLWEPIHRCLTGDYAPSHELDFEAGEPPLNLAVLGGEQLLEQGYRSLALVSAEQVPQVAAALAGVGREWFRERFMALPANQYHEITEEMCGWVWEHVEQLARFYASAARRGCAVLCTISH
jgi:hypothetical protein